MTSQLEKAPQSSASKTKSALVAITAIFMSAGLFLYWLASQGNQDDTLRAALSCEPAAVPTFKDSGKVIAFTIKGVSSNYTLAHPESPFLFQRYLVRYGSGGRGTSYKDILVPSLVEIVDSSGLKVNFDFVDEVYMNQIATVASGEPLPDYVPENVRKAGGSDLFIYTLDRNKPVTCVGIVSSSSSGLRLHGDTWHKTVVSNLSLPEMLQFDEQQTRERSALISAIMPAGFVLWLVLVGLVLLSPRREKGANKKSD